MKIAILGTNGMLGSNVFETLSREGFNTIGLSRPSFDAEFPNFSAIRNCDYIINCIGIIKPYIKNDNPNDILQAIKINSIFPHILAKTDAKIIQIATDCVYDGTKGKYIETDSHNATDIYGKTKSLGEVQSDNFLNLRCSIIGREKKGFLSLLEWFLHQPQNAELNGFKNHLWNGITTNAFSKICAGLIKNNSWFSGTTHIVPLNTISKAQMLHTFAKHFNRNDIKIHDIDAPIKIDRTLDTINHLKNKKLWNDAGYLKIPTIEEMIQNLE